MSLQAQPNAGLLIKSQADSSFWYVKNGQLPLYTRSPIEYDNAKRKFITALSNPDALKDPAAREALKFGYSNAFNKMAAANQPGVAIAQKDALSAAAVQPITLLQDFTVKYANAGFMALGLFPIRPTPTEAGTYLEYLRGTQFNPQRQRGGGGTRTAANAVSGPRVEKRPYTVDADSETLQLGKDLVLSEDTSPINAMFELRERVDYELALRREEKVIGIVTDLASYATSNRRTLSPGYHWDEPDADVFNQLLKAKAALWSGSGSTMTVGWCSLPVWNALRNARSVSRVLSANHQGFLTAEEFCEIMDIDALMVSELRGNEANIAEAPSYTRSWGNHFGIMRVSMFAQKNDASFGAMIRWMPNGLKDGIESNLWYDPKSSAFGDFHYKASLKEVPIVVARDTGYLFKNVLSAATPLY
jgi:hypothetical protein